ncbi:MAG: hypothetical protein RI590_02405 [Microbacteriaceae bacterium]|jgi:ribosome-binding protein aMBF1 (putative translation factor)|nr:hypothetical protein [Microbacteriaceae bacterium]MDR9443532.1 hypothetical protein [Microbacteriaceae bacterium]
MTETTTLSPADRCDICGAQAYVIVKLESGELLFCGHHGKVNKEKLEPIMVDWQDKTDLISH